MSIVALGLNMLLAVLLAAALFMGWRLNGRLKTLRASHEGFAQAVGELNAAARRAEQSLADLRGASDDAAVLLGERIERAQALAARLERALDKAPSLPAADEDAPGERRLGALIAAARQPRPRLEPERPTSRREPLVLRTPVRQDDDLFDEPAERGGLTLARGGRR
jgi:hypothetical protein